MDKDESEFYVSRTRKSGRCSRCIECMKEWAMNRYYNKAAYVFLSPKERKTEDILNDIHRMVEESKAKRKNEQVTKNVELAKLISRPKEEEISYEKFIQRKIKDFIFIHELKQEFKIIGA